MALLWLIPHSAFRMEISQVCKVFNFTCWSFPAFKAHLRRFRACSLWKDSDFKFALQSWPSPGCTLGQIWGVPPYCGSSVWPIKSLSRLYIAFSFSPPPLPFLSNLLKSTESYLKPQMWLLNSEQWTPSLLVHLHAKAQPQVPQVLIVSLIVLLPNYTLLLPFWQKIIQLFLVDVQHSWPGPGRQTYLGLILGCPPWQRPGKTCICAPYCDFALCVKPLRNLEIKNLQ